MRKFPTLKNYNNWPSKQAVNQNQAIFYDQQFSIERLSPCSRQDFSKTDTGFFKDKKLKVIPVQDMDLIAQDPIAREVMINRQRAKSVLKQSSTRKNQKLEVQAYDHGKHTTVATPRLASNQMVNFNHIMDNRANSQVVKKKYVVSSLLNQNKKELEMGLSSPAKAPKKAVFTGFMVPDISMLSTKVSFRKPSE